jgi:hypothetical protein
MTAADANRRLNRSAIEVVQELILPLIEAFANGLRENEYRRRVRADGTTFC